MKLNFSPEDDALYLILGDGKVIESEEVAPGVILDFDESEQVVAIEVLRVSQRNLHLKREVSAAV